jgi:hypothetical protein
MNNHHTKFEFLGLSVLKLLIGNRSYLQGQCDLDLSPLDPKINRSHLLVLTNHHAKFEVPRSNVLKLLIGNHFYIQGYCDLDL